MFSTREMAEVAISEFRRGLEGLTPEEWLVRQPKSDGTSMNAISWTVQHIGAHWASARVVALGLPFERLNPPRDGTPPPFGDALAILEKSTEDVPDRDGRRRAHVRHLSSG